MPPSRFLLGFAAGAVFASVAAYLLMPSADHHADALARTTRDGSPRSSDQYEVPPQAVTEAPLPAAPLVRHAPSTVQQEAISRTTESVEEPPPPSATLPPVHLTVEHARLLKPSRTEDRPPTVAELHQDFSLEDRDQSWATEMEQGLQSFVAMNLPPPEFELKHLECRATLCEILAFGNLPESSRRWNTGLQQLNDEPWSSGQFHGNSTSATDESGRATIITILQRARK